MITPLNIWLDQQCYNPWLVAYKEWVRFFVEDRAAMRRFIRHPANVPIAYSLGESEETIERLKDVSNGGLCFSASRPLEIGTVIQLEIALDSCPFEATGIVAWCKPEEDHYAVGVAFSDQSTRFNVRMVEQICHIEEYREQVMHEEGRTLSSEDAAREWVEKYAADFPQ